MDAVVKLRTVRRVLTGLAALLFAGATGELIAVKHYDDKVQLLPFVLCGIGLICLMGAVLHPATRVVTLIRVAMLAIAAGSAFGVWEHLAGNADFYKEIHPHATTSTLVKQALTGRDPLMAPGILAVAALLTILVTYLAEPPRFDLR